MFLDIAAHRNILLQILKDIYTDITIGPILGFKGGTAAYLFYGLNRFSVDLDFDLLDETKINNVYEKLKKIIKEYGVIKDDYKKQNTIFFLISYDERSRNIKVEVNLRKLGSRFEVKTYLGISMKVMVQEDMFAYKMVAMMERIGKANRDIFDIHFFLKNNWPINKEIIEKRANMSFMDFLKKCISSFEKMSNRRILSGIGELLDDKQKAWVKTHLIKDTLFLLKIKSDSENKRVI